MKGFFKKSTSRKQGQTKRSMGSQAKNAVDNPPILQDSPERSTAPLSSAITPPAIDSPNSNSAVPSSATVTVHSKEVVPDSSAASTSRDSNGDPVRQQTIKVPKELRPKVDLWKKAYDKLREDPETKGAL